MINEAIVKTIEKIELQSVLVLFITVGAGVFLLKIDNTFNSPAGILGSISIVIGLLYTYMSFTTNQLKENYEGIIKKYETIMTTQGYSGVNKELVELTKTSMAGKHDPIAIGSEYNILEPKGTTTVN